MMLPVLTALVALLSIGAVHCEDETIGPIFMKEPPNRVDFSNTTGAVVECAARGSPTPDVIWVRADGTAVGDVPGLRQVLPNGNLVFPPFRAEDYRQEVHAQVYACLARNPVGTIHSRDVNVRAVVAQQYDTDVNKEYVIMGNSIILKCQVPSFVADFIDVLSWHTDENEDFYPGENYEGKYLVLPSGELHIRDVGPEDGYKSYQCRTKHRLTGETRLSATKGRLVITEPIGRVPPKLSTTQVSITFTTTLGMSFTLLCPAQAFPVPMFRTRWTRTAQIFIRCDGNDDWSQGYRVIRFTMPRPGVPGSAFQSPWVESRQNLRLATKVEPSIQRKTIMSRYCAPRKLTPPRPSEPVGSKSPTFSNDVQFSGITRKTGQDFALLCQAQAYPVPIFRRKLIRPPCSKPVGSKPPTFTTDFTLSAVTRHKDQSFSMMCQAQAFPIPIFRQNRSVPSPLRSRLSLWGAYLENVSDKGSVFYNRWDLKPLLFLRTLVVQVSFEQSIKVSDCCVKRKRFLFPYSEPIASAVPSVTSTPKAAVHYAQLSSLALLCPAQGYPVPVSRWYKFIDGTTRKQPVVLNDRVKQVSGTLIIKEAKVEDSGKYLCVVNNSVGGESVETVLTVTAPLKSTVEPATQTVDFGRPAVFTCRYEGNPIKTVTWLKDGKDMNHHDAILRIESVKKEDKGMYQCFIRNDQESAGASAELKLGGRFEPPQIRHSFGEQTLRSGPPLRLKCVASGNPTPDIAWLLDGDKLSSGERLQIGQFVTADGNVESHLNISSVHTNDGGLYSCIASSKVGSASHAARVNVYGLPYVRPMKKRPINRKQKVYPNGTLVIENVERMSDQATYTCVAKNSQSYTAKGTLELQVMVPPQILPFEFGDEPANAGDLTSVTCAVNKGDQPLEISWTLNGHALRRNNDLGVTITNINKKTSILNIDSVAAIHRGLYYCVAKNAAGIANHSAVLEVNVPPRWILEPTDKAFAQGSDAKVECKADGFPKPQVTWKRAEGDTPGDYKDLKPNNPNVKVEDGTLTINNIQKTNEGYYLCEAVNGIGSGLSAVILISVQAPPQFEIKMRNQTARRSEPAVLQCQAKGEKPIGIIWNMNNKRLEPKSDPRYTIREEILPGGVVSDLSIRRTERSDSALFTCVATNAFGSDDTSINMIIQEVPEAPYGLKVLDKSGRTVQLSWAAPYDGNSPIKKFLIEYKRAKGNWEKDIDRVLVPGDATEAGVFSLRPATAYHIRIVAENELGTSETYLVTFYTNKINLNFRYYVGYKLASSNKSFVFETVDISKESGKEHHLDILNLKTYTQYAIVVQVFNKMGSGPVSGEVRAYTAEGAPSAPPQDVLCTTLTAQTIRVSWVSPPLAAANGLIKGYKVIYGPSDTWYDEKSKDTKITASSETILHGLKKFTNYSMEVLATTNGGDGVRSAPIHCQTEQDVPEAPRAVKALVMGADSILVSWRPPAQPNGLVTHYNVYTQAQNTEPHPNKYKEDVKLPCLAVGVPSPNIIWKVKGQPLEGSERVRQLPEGSLQIAGVAREDAGEYSCHVDNQFGTDTVTHTLSVLAPPFPPQLSIASSSVSSLTLRLKPSLEAEQSPAAGYTIHYKQEFGDWETVQIPSNTDTYTLENLFCGSRYQLYVTAYNGIGTGEASDVVIARTRGSKPPVPRAADFIEVGSSSVTLHLKQWLDGGCPMSHFVVENKKKGAAEWNQISNAVKPGGNFVVLDLEPATWYVLRITAHNNAGFNVAEYEFATLTMTGGTIAPARDVNDGNLTTEQTIKIILLHLNLIVPVVAVILVIIIAIVVVCVVRGARDHHKGITLGTIAPLPGNADKDLPPWVKAWLEPEVLVPILATIVVFIVGVVVICLTLARRNTPHRLRGQKDVYYDAVYNASQAALGGGAGTLDKRGGLRDELGYIAPPNRKLPPVPGSNYNTCDRVKRQAVIMGAHSTWDPRRHHYERVRRPRLRRTGSGDTISTGMEDEICPYATFHLLGFREEMDPSKALAFPHHHPGHPAHPAHAAHTPHAGTLAHPHPHHPAHSRAGSQSMPRANSRYARKNPACCQPEDEQYTGAYGTPYSDHYGSRPSIGTRKCGSSPEPPPPPPRNANTDNNCSSSFNESKDSNEISEAECDQPRNYPVRAHTAKDGLHSEEMRKLIDRPEANTPIPQQAVHGRGGLTAYDTVAV
ncbi:PREDICTED: LOW QUALITY PROTEIN: Down syndrome cell adhesion molecule-like protein Dscam2 [Papilio polytes]|uniref:LOW QUALITY PROTEIN: Down syndrome cell adhesion molecule-like protein Dscam2 n=1 Tax=Papilio polytes TaxID=76194 RepID=UPI0006761754|nr:PREDICTED: LOW QUALITY PROTEIN: Down syndrome cell adhesion molecule-like protein Dscam2 [Papilio polytes]